MNYRLVLSLSVLLLSATANAGTLMAAEFTGQVQQFTNGGKASGCGVTISGVELSGGANILVFNGSTVLYANGVGQVKGRASRVEAKKMSSPDFSLKDLKPQVTTAVWFKAPPNAATSLSHGSRVEQSEDKGYILYKTNFEPVTSVLKAVLRSEKIQVGMLYDGTNSEQVMFGVVNVTDDEKEQLINCMKEMFADK